MGKADDQGLGAADAGRHQNFLTATVAKHDIVTGRRRGLDPFGIVVQGNERDAFGLQDASHALTGATVAAEDDMFFNAKALAGDLVDAARAF